MCYVHPIWQGTNHKYCFFSYYVKLSSGLADLAGGNWVCIFCPIYNHLHSMCVFHTCDKPSHSATSNPQRVCIQTLHPHVAIQSRLYFSTATQCYYNATHVINDMISCSPTISYLLKKTIQRSATWVSQEKIRVCSSLSLVIPKELSCWLFNSLVKYLSEYQI